MTVVITAKLTTTMGGSGRPPSLAHERVSVMQHVRRLASIPAIAAVGLLALAGCRSEPGVAAYVGDTKITEDRVTAIVDEAVRSRSDEAGDAMPVDRGTVVSTLILNEVCAHLDLAPQPDQPPVTAEQVASGFGISADTEFARRGAEMQNCLRSLKVGPPIAPTKEELADLMKRARAAGAIPDGMSDEDAARQYDNRTLRGALAQRKVLSDALTEHDVSVNPRYRPLEFPLLFFQTGKPAVVVMLGEPGSDAIVERR